MSVDGAHGLLGEARLCGMRAAHAGLEWCETGGPGLRPFMRKYLAGEREKGLGPRLEGEGRRGRGVLFLCRVGEDFV